MKTLTEYEKQKIEELSTILYEVMLKQKPYVKNFPLGQLEKRVSDFLLDTIRETEERTLNIIADGEGWEESREHYRKKLKQEK